MKSTANDNGPAIGCLVRVDQLTSGDVLMLDGTGKIADGIRYFSKASGPYSHVAIFCSDTVLFEAEEWGSGETWLPFKLLVETRHLWVYLPCNKGTFVVARHPDLQALSDSERRERVKVATERHRSLPYSPSIRMRGTTWLSSWLEFLPEALLNQFGGAVDWFFELRRHPDSTSGVFCSEVVTLVYREMGLDLFPGIPAQDVSPAMFQTCEFLRPIVLENVLTEAEAQTLDPTISFREMHARHLESRRLWVGTSVFVSEQYKASEVSRAKFASDLKQKDSEFRVRVVEEMHSAARYGKSEWESELQQFLADDEIRQGAFRFAESPLGTDEDIAAFFAYRQRMIDFEVANLRRGLTYVHNLEAVPMVPSDKSNLRFTAEYLEREVKRLLACKLRIADIQRDFEEAIKKIRGAGENGRPSL